jgi:cytidylate kinase
MTITSVTQNDAAAGEMGIPQMIAIDGPAGSGKSTIGERLSKELDYLYFDTGVMYRAVTLAALERFSSADDEEAVSKLAEQVRIDVKPPSLADGRVYDVILDGNDVTWAIRSPQVEACVSEVSAYPGVRKAMTEQQRRIGLRGRVVMVGRDIGTVVLPDADLKIYLDASVEERAIRRHRENLQRGKVSVYETVLEGIKHRDQIDSSRAAAPLRMAEDAVRVYTDGLSVEEVMAKVRKLLS